MSRHFAVQGSRKPDKSEDLNISPLIDMVFILLIFFIVTTVFVDEAGIRTVTPSPDRGITSALDDPAPNFEIDRNGEITCDEHVVNLAAVQTIVRNASNRNVQVHVHPDAMSGWMVQVIDAARLGGADLVSVTHLR